MLALTKTQILIVSALSDQSLTSNQLADHFKLNLRSTQSLLKQLCDQKIVSRKKIGRSSTYKLC